MLNNTQTNKEMSPNREKMLRALDLLAAKAEAYERSIGPGLGLKIRRISLLKLKYLTYMALRVLGKESSVRARFFYGFTAKLPILDANARHLYFMGALSPEEEPLTKFFIKNLKEDDVFYDIGASYGFYTYLASTLLTRGNVHAFEPNRLCGEYLEANAEHAENIRINKYGLYDEDGERPYYGQDATFSSGSAGNSLVQEVSDDKALHELYKVQTVTLDTYVKDHQAPTVLKIDVEGGELSVLKGAQNFLKANNPIVTIEVWGGEEGRKFSQPAVTLLQTFGYTPHRILANGDVERVGEIDFTTEQAAFTNYVFKK